jgi:dTDP-4-dehydrorhamnose 3,5-epimerase
VGSVSLNDIVVTPLARMAVAGGDVLHAMKSTDTGYSGFGEAYFSSVSMDVVKAWKLHSQMTMNIVVPVGRVRFVFYSRETDAFRIEEIGSDRYARLTVPPGIWFGFQGMSAPCSILLNIANIVHDPTEVQRAATSEIKFDWSSS